MNKIIKNLNYKMISCFIIIGILFIAAYCYAPFTYQENDDMMLQRLVSGVETGQMETHLIHINYILGLILSSLYRIIPIVPWYGLMLCACHYLCMVLVLYVCMREINNIKNKILIIILFCCTCLLIWMPQVINQQFTVTASILCGTAIIYFLTTKETTSRNVIVRNNIIIVLLVAFAFCIRWKTTLMSLPFVFVAWIIKQRTEKRKIIILPCIICSTMILLFIINEMSYRSPEWKVYRQYDAVRVKLFDYEMLPAYHEVEELCDKYKVSEELYKTMVEDNLLIFDNNITTEFLQELYDQAKLIETDQYSISQKIVKTVQIYIDRLLNSSKQYSFIVLIFYILLFSYAILRKNKTIPMILHLCFLGFMRSLVWMIILYQGRCPERITVSLYLIELLVLVGWVIQENVIQQIVKNHKLYLGFLSALIVFSFIKWSIPNLVWLNERTETKLEISADYKKLLKYCRSNSNNFYFLEVPIISTENTITELVLQPDFIKTVNYAFTGGWLARSPWYTNKYEQYGITDSEESLFTDNGYIVFRDDHLSSIENVYHYFNEKYPESILEEVDKIASYGKTIYHIYKLRYE